MSNKQVSNQTSENPSEKADRLELPLITFTEPDEPELNGDKLNKANTLANWAKKLVEDAGKIVAPYLGQLGEYAEGSASETCEISAGDDDFNFVGSAQKALNRGIQAFIKTLATAVPDSQFGDNAFEGTEGKAFKSTKNASKKVFNGKTERVAFTFEGALIAEDNDGHIRKIVQILAKAGRRASNGDSRGATTSLSHLFGDVVPFGLENALFTLDAATAIVRARVMANAAHDAKKEAAKLREEHEEEKKAAFVKKQSDDNVEKARKAAEAHNQTTMAATA